MLLVTYPISKRNVTMNIALMHLILIISNLFTSPKISTVVKEWTLIHNGPVVTWANPAGHWHKEIKTHK